LLVFVKRVTNEKINVTVFSNKKFVSKSTLEEYILNQKSEETVVIKYA
jgi:hypothetical protein